MVDMQKEDIFTRVHGCMEGARCRRGIAPFIYTPCYGLAYAAQDIHGMLKVYPLLFARSEPCMHCVNLASPQAPVSVCVYYTYDIYVSVCMYVYIYIYIYLYMLCTHATTYTHIHTQRASDLTYAFPRTQANTTSTSVQPPNHNSCFCWHEHSTG